MVVFNPVSLFVFLLLGPLQGVQATPLVDSTVALSITPAEKGLESRDWTSCIDGASQIIALVEKYPQYKAEFKAYGTVALGGIGTMSICKTFKVESIDCNYAGLSVSSALGIAVFQGFIAPEASKDTKGATDAVPKDELRRHIKRLPARLEAHLLDRGLSFDSITSVPIQKRDGVGLVSHVVEVRGLQDKNETDAVATDLRINTREDGAANIQIFPAADGAPEKRSGAIGFKISFKVTNGNGQPRESIYKELCDKISKHWAESAKNKKDMVDYLGNMHFDTFGDLSFRIHPEVSYYELNYEDVNKCQGR